MKSAVTRRISQIVISSMVILAVIGSLLFYFVSAKKLALDAKKKMELTQLFTVIEMYYISENIAPENPNNDNWCVIDKFYSNKKCLRELNRDGYIGALPISPNEDQYYYHNDDEMFIVATRMDSELNKKEKCPYSKDENVWCRFYLKK